MSARGRIETLLRECRKSEIDGVIILPGPNMRYLVDFTLETFERPAFLVAGFDSEPVLVVPRLDEDRARVAVSDLCEVRSYTDDTGPWKHVESVLHGFEGIAGVEGKMPVSFYKTLQSKAPKLRFEDLDDLLTDMRVCKDPEELARHRQAADLLQEAMSRTIVELRPGISERQVALTFYKHAEDLGAEDHYCLIQAGPNSANPHMEPTRKTIQNDEVVVFDAAVCYRGYYSDVTRTFVVGKASDMQVKVFDTVLESQTRAIEKITHGVSAEEIDRAAREEMKRSGFAEFFIHRTGHGLGLEIHEEPYIRGGNKMQLKVGMVFTVEPGVYLPGRFGIRLEDNIIMTETGIENTTRLPKAMNPSRC